MAKYERREMREKTEIERKLLGSIGFDSYETNRFYSKIENDLGNIKVETERQFFIYDPDSYMPLQIITKEPLKRENPRFTSQEDFKKILKLADAGYDISIDEKFRPIASLRKDNFFIEMPVCEKRDFAITMGGVTHMFPYNEAFKEEIATAIERGGLTRHKFEKLFDGMARADYEKVKDVLGPAAYSRILRDFEKMDKEKLAELVDEVFGKQEKATNIEIKQESWPQFNITETATSKMCSLTFENDSSIGGTIPNPGRGDQIMVFIRNDRGEPRWEEIPNLPHIAESFPRLLENCELNHRNINSFIYDAKEMSVEEFNEKYPIPELTKESSIENNIDLEQ